MKTIEDHIQKDKDILADPNTSEPMRHHIELHLKVLQKVDQNEVRANVI